MSVGPHLSGEADVGPAIPGNSRAAPMRRFAAERRRDKNGLRAGLAGMIAIIAAVAPGPIRGGYDLNWLPQPRRFAYGLR
jgi:hypothetical protein